LADSEAARDSRLLETTVSVQYELLEPEPDGCNWSRDLVINYGRDDCENVLRHLRPLYEDARRRFNVSER